MSRTVPWSVKDMGSDARQSAQRSGLSVGDWLDELIADHAQKTFVAAGGGGLSARIPDHHAARDAKGAAPVPPVQGSYELAATGTDGPLRRFAQAEPQVAQVFDTPADVRQPPLVRGGDLGTPRSPSRQTLSTDEPLTARPFSRSNAVGSDDGRMKEQLIREAVAAITRRQAALEATAPPGDVAPPAATVGEIGNAILAIEARLAGARASRAEAAAPVSTPRDGDPRRCLDSDGSKAFETLGQDLRQAIKDLDQRVRPSAAMGGDPKDGLAPRFEERHTQGENLLTSTARLPPAIEAPAAQPIPFRAPFDGAARQTGPRTDPDRIWGDVRALLDRLGPESALDTLDRRLQDLAGTVERHIGGSSSSALIADLSRRIDALQASIAAPTGDRQAFDHVLGGIEERIAKARLASSDIQHLEDMMNGLASRLEDSHRQPDAKALTALETQIERLGARLDRSESSLSSLDSVEHSLRDLFTQLEQTRHATIDAAESAARTAARDTLRAALQSPGVTASSDIRSALAEKLGRDLQDLKQQHDASERRTQAALSGLHQAVEKLVDGLAHQAPGAAQTGRRAPDGRVPGVDDGPVAPSVQAIHDEVDSRRSDGRNPRAAPVANPADMLIEPGEGRLPRASGQAKIEAPDLVTGRPRSSGVSAPVIGADGSASFIAAARRAAQAAQASAASRQKPVQARDGDASPSKIASSAVALIERVRAYLALRRRPALLGLAGLVLLLGALEAAKLSLDEPAAKPPIVADRDGGVASPVLPAPAPAASVPDGQKPVGADAGAGSLPASAPASDPSPSASAPEADSPPEATKPSQPPKVSNPFLAGIASEPSGIGEGLKALAQAGNPAAEYEVGLRYVEGRSVPRDPKTAAGWFEKAANHGLAAAQYRLGSAYEKGVGETRDPAMATAWYSRAADAGNIRAMHNLAVMSAEGAVGKPDYAKAATLFGKAAVLGVRDSQFNLAILYARGLGIEQNLAQSYTWFAIAAAQGDEDAAKKRDEVAARLDAKTLDAAKTAAENFRAAPSVRSANDVLPPPGGWDAVPPPPASGAAGRKAGAVKSTVM